MRPSILAMLVAFGTTITMSATAQQPYGSEADGAQ